MVSSLPTGVVTLLFTDVAGSTRLLQALGDDYGEALHEHRRRLRAAFADHEGIEVNTQGDAFFVAFALASDAVAAAADGQRAEAHHICMLVEGLPLGIELAASWVSTLSCAEIAERSERNIDSLAMSMRDVPERHRSLRAAFDQSWRLLSGKQQDVLARLSVLRGDFDRAACAAVAGADVRTFSDLVSKSLVRRLDYGRYALHELLRQYAAERLAASPAEERDTRERHARHYSGMLIERQAAFMGPEFAVARDELRGELDNLRAAADWILAEDDEYVATPVLEAFYMFLWMHSWFEGGETLGLLERTAGFDADDPRSTSAVALTAAMHRVAIGARLGYDPAAEELAARCLPVLRARNLERELAGCLCALGIMAVYRDVFPEAVAFLEEGTTIAKAISGGLMESGALMDLGFARLLLGDLKAARQAFEAAHVLSEKLGNPLLRAYATSKLGLLADAEERFGDAVRLHLEANELFAGVGDVGGTGYALSRASLSAYGVEDYEEALRLGRAGYEAFSEVNHRWGMIAALCRIGFAALALGDVDEAQRSLHAALERAHASAAISLELLALSGVGAVLHATGDRERAATVLTFALGHEQLPPSYGFAARPALEALEAELSPAQLAAVRLAAADTSLEDLIMQALEPRVSTNGVTHGR